MLAIIRFGIRIRDVILGDRQCITPSITVAPTLDAHQQVDYMTFLAAKSHQHHGASSNTQEVVGDQDDGVEMEMHRVTYHSEHAAHVGRA